MCPRVGSSINPSEDWIRVQQNDYPITQVVPNARQALSVFHRANRVQQSHTTVTNTSQVTWIPPPANSLKINFDGALFKDINKAGLGVVIRNDHGQVIASLSEQIQMPFSSDLVEALAAARAISFAYELSFTNYVLEGDSDVVIKALKHSDDSLSSFGHILASAKTLTDVKCITFSHTRRSGNAVAHNLAKHARHVLGFKVWIEDVPPHLHYVLIADYG
ncbi:uncharacterized protein LOC136063608 [Quercus suber]|uniref:uncharacterized protein LOC136063608 n=1 Tax=Quercus suber TaxID=58331 RepID=UPI0032DF5E6D